MDKAIRKELWPKVAAARQVGKKAYFVGVRAFVDGKEISPYRLKIIICPFILFKN